MERQIEGEAERTGVRGTEGEIERVRGNEREGESNHTTNENLRCEYAGPMINRTCLMSSGLASKPEQSLVI